MSLPVKLVRNLCLLMHILYMLLKYYKLVLFFSNYKEKNTHKIKDPHKVDKELWPLVCCMIRGNAQSKKMGTKLELDHPIYILMRQKFPLFSPCVKLMSWSALSFVHTWVKTLLDESTLTCPLWQKKGSDNECSWWLKDTTEPTCEHCIFFF